jgi:hypothetical protein
MPLKLPLPPWSARKRARRSQERRVASDDISIRSGWTQKLPEGYGSVSPETIRDYSKKIGQTLTAKGVQYHVGEPGGFHGNSRQAMLRNNLPWHSSHRRQQANVQRLQKLV